MAKKSRRKRGQTKKRKVNDGGMSLSDIKKMYDIIQDFKWCAHSADNKEWEEITSWYREGKLKPRVQRLWIGFWIMFVGLNLFWVCMMLSKEGVANPIGAFLMVNGGTILCFGGLYYYKVTTYEKQRQRLNLDCVREVVLEEMDYRRSRYDQHISYYFWVWNEDKNRFYLKGLRIFYDDGWYDRYWYPGQIMYYVEGAVELIPKAGINNTGKVVKD